MPLNLRGSDKNQNFNMPVSYKIQDNRGKFLDARNVNTIQGRLDTRFGISRFNAVALSGPILSLSTFVKTDGTRYTIAKIGTELVSVSATGSHTVIKSGLSASTKHKGITGNNRHIISVESDGLFSWNGTTFTQLGQAAPTSFSAVIASGGSLITTNKYRVAISFYASSIGFESNAFNGAEITATSPNLKIDVSALPLTAANALVDKVYIYLKNVTTDSEYVFIDEVALGTATYSITAQSLSTQVPQTTNDVPGRNAFDLNGTTGGDYLNFFNSKLIYVCNGNEVNFSETDLLDAFNSLDTGLVLAIPGQGKVIGTAIGLFNDTVLDPFLIIFKRKSTHIYSEIGGIPKLVELNDKIGCVSHHTIQVKNGIVYFLSDEGWRGIVNGKFIANAQGEAITLGNGDIDDIFKSEGFTYQVNRQGLANSFSVYYPTLDQYITWVSEGANNAFSKAYVYEFDTGGFKPFEFSLSATCAVLGENSDGRDQVLFGTTDGFIMKHSILEDRSDADATNAAVAINAYAVLSWIPSDGDFDATYNFRELILKAITSSSELTVTTYINYNLSTSESKTYDFSDPSSGFILDESILDEGVLSDDRTIISARSDIGRVGESIAIGFYQNAIGSNMGLISMQIDSSKNGNRNIPSESEEGSFDASTESYFPSASDSAMAAAASAAAAAAQAANVAADAILYALIYG